MIGKDRLQFLKQFVDPLDAAFVEAGVKLREASLAIGAGLHDVRMFKRGAMASLRPSERGGSKFSVGLSVLRGGSVELHLPVSRAEAVDLGGSTAAGPRSLFDHNADRNKALEMKVERLG